MIGTRDTTVDLASRGVLIAAILIHLTGPSVFLLQPLVVQGLVEQLGFSPQRANFTMFVEGAGKAAMALTLIGLVSRVNWRLMLLGALVTLIAGNLASMVVTQGELFLAIRAITGAAAGVIVPLSYAMIGLTPKADRNFGLMWVVLFVYAGIAFIVLPIVVQAAGINGMFAAFALLAALGLPLVSSLPTSGDVPQGRPDAQSATEGPVEVSWPKTFLAILAMFLFSASMFAFWANAALIAKAAAIPEGDIAYGLSTSQFVSLGGALITSIVAVRFGRIPPLTSGFLLLAASIAVLAGRIDAMLFIVAICAFNFAWNMTDPYMLGSMASFGRGGRVIVYATAFRMIGVSVGPGLASLLLSLGYGFDGVIALSLAILAACFAALLPGLLAQRRAMAATAGASR